jgi:hypothetical protein
VIILLHWIAAWVIVVAILAVLVFVKNEWDQRHP